VFTAPRHRDRPVVYATRRQVLRRREVMKPPLAIGPPSGAQLAMPRGSDQDRRADWLWLIRRSLGLPDIMTERAARTVIVGRIASTFDGGEATASGQGMAPDLLDAILDLGARGDLDDCLVNDESMIRDLRVADIGIEDVGSRVISQADVRGATPTMHRVGAAARAILTDVAAYVRDNPDL
jgi:hypothetical protein